MYTATNGGTWRWRRDPQHGIPWNFVNPLKNNPCTDGWAGVACDCDIIACHVVKLNLTHHNVTGHLPMSIGTFTRLEELDFSQNSIGGPLPITIKYMSNITSIDLTSNFISGTIPEEFFMNFTRIETVRFGANKFDGYIPTSLFTNCTMLTDLDLGVNSLHGTIPVEIVQRNETLRRLGLNRNDFYGPVLDLIAQLTLLDRVYLHNNKFTGTIPIALGNIKELHAIDLSNNNFHGSFPSGFSDTWGGLTSFTVIANALTGTLPDDLFSNSHFLLQIQLSGNLLSGTVPTSFIDSSTLASLKVLALDANRFHGSFPSYAFSKLPSLIELYLDANLFTGRIVDLLETKLSLRYVTFAENQFTGPLPNVTLPDILFVLGADNYFTGTIPSILSESIYMFNFGFSNNAIHGTLPDWLCTSYRLEYFAIDTNMLSGTIPGNFSHKNLLQQISVNDNFLSSSLPRNVALLGHLTQLYIQNNLFTGLLPKGLLQLERLQVVYAQNNKFSGPLLPQVNPYARDDDYGFVPPIRADDDVLPSPIPTLPFLAGENGEERVQRMLADDDGNTSVPSFLYAQLLNLDVSNNLLTGTVPKGFFKAAPFLQAYVLSSNCFSGNIPEEICSSTSLISIALDGMGSANKCQKPILPGVPYFSQFRNQKAIHGEIPPCIFQLPNLQTLHLSGNGLSGTLPSSLNDPSNITPTLQVLSIAHNSLSGSIPLGIQQRVWSTLDLSFNKFSGILDDSFQRVASNASVSLNINRLSGDIPEAFLQSDGNVSMLDGNIFFCKSDLGTGKNMGLPQQDPDYHIYSCGSDSVTRSIFIWFGVACIVVAAVMVWISIIYYTNSNSSSAGSTKAAAVTVAGRQALEDEKTKREQALAFMGPRGIEEEVHLEVEKHRSQWWWRDWMEDIVIWIRIVTDTRVDDNTVVTGKEKERERNKGKDKEKDNKDELPAFVQFLQRIRQVFFFAAAFGVCFLMPFYEILTVQLGGGTYAHEYAWTYSAILLSGWLPGTLLFIAFFFTMCLVIYLFHRYFQSFSSIERSDGKGKRARTRTGSSEEAVTATEKDGQKDGNAARVSSMRMSSLSISTATGATLRPSAAIALNPENERSFSSSSDATSISGLPASPATTQSLSSRLATSLLQTCFWWRMKRDDNNGEFEGETEAEARQRRRDHRITTLTIAFFNLAFMIMVDIGYVIIILRSGPYVVFFTQFSLSIFKLFWNEIVLWKSIPYFKKYVYRKIVKVFGCCCGQPSKSKKKVGGLASQEGQGEADDEVDEALLRWQQRLESLSISPSKYRFNENEISFILLTVLLNNVIIPCLSIAIVSSDCYYDAFFPSPPTSTYTLYSCQHPVSLSFYQTCYGEYGYVESTTYDPPFSYRHQCSAAFAINYTAVYVYMFMNVGLVSPAIKIMVKLLYRRLTVKAERQQMKSEKKDKSTGSGKAGIVRESLATPAWNGPRLTSESLRRSSAVPASEAKPSWRQRLVGVLDRVMPAGLRDVQFKDEQPVGDAEVGAGLGNVDTAAQGEEERETVGGGSHPHTRQISTASDTPSVFSVSVLVSEQISSLGNTLTSYVRERIHPTLHHTEDIGDEDDEDGEGEGEYDEEFANSLRNTETENATVVSAMDGFKESETGTGVGSGWSSSAGVSASVSVADSVGGTLGVRGVSRGIEGERSATTDEVSLVPTSRNRTMKKRSIRPSTSGAAATARSRPNNQMQEKAVFFKRYKFVVRMNAYMAILLTFGTIFPPLAVLICLAVWSSTWYEHLIMGRVLLMAKRQQAQAEAEAIARGGYSSVAKYYTILRRKLSKEVVDIDKYYFSTLWSLICFGSFAYAYILFDTFSDQFGWQTAVIPTVLMLFMPVLLWLITRVTMIVRQHRAVQAAQQITGKSGVVRETEGVLGAVELEHVVSPMVSVDRGSGAAPYSFSPTQSPYGSPSGGAMSRKSST